MDSVKTGIPPGLFLLLTKVRKLLAEQGIEGYVVGGLVRDLLLGWETADIDIAVKADSLDIARKVAVVLGGKYVLLDKVNKIARVVLEEETESRRKYWELDFSCFEDSIEQDLKRRDFTIDALAIDLKQLDKPADFEFIDLVNGIVDLRRGVIRVVNDDVFSSDPARLLRAVRLAAELNFTIEKKTESSIKRDAHLVTAVAGERVREELLRLMSSHKAGQCLSYLDELGLLIAIIPELAVMKGVEQLREHFWDVFDHSLKTVEACDFLLRQNDWEYGAKEALTSVPWSPELIEYFDTPVNYGSTILQLLKVAALLHDVAKPQTKTIEADGRTRFLGHAQEGAGIAASILERLRFSAREINYVEIMVRDHLRPTQMAQEGLPTRRAIYRYFRDSGEVGISTLFLSLADHLAARGPNLDLSNWQEHNRVVEYVLAQSLEKGQVVSPPRLVNGYDIINIFGLVPGPKIGQILEALWEAQAGEEVTTKEEALAFISRLLTTSETDKRT